MLTRRLDRKPSWTAEFTAAQRAAETVHPHDRRLLDDRYSHRFVRDPALRMMLSHPLIARGAIYCLDRLVGGLQAHTVLRVRYVDDAYRAAVAAGVRQSVLLGAGFDTTSLRTADATTRIFEVDAPSTQKAKRARFEQLFPQHRPPLTWVACDFQKDDLRERLLANGLDPGVPSLIVWTGVTTYLPVDAIRATMHDLAAVCAPGSRLVLDYIDPDVITGTTPWRGARWLSRIVARLGEPFRSGFTSAELDALLGSCGFRLHDVSRVPTLLCRYDPASRRGLHADDWLGIATAIRE
ncbi:class I SAM-dependent methyltransferase [Nocardia transvalensis]|uniref:class I SAM-dependent methyltransferase n=1 Tax=Nocardia transvalensis TaxID=37333 RepID=UPI003A5D109A